MARSMQTGHVGNVRRGIGRVARCAIVATAAVAIKVRMESGEVVALTLPVLCYVVDAQAEDPGAAPGAVEPAKTAPEVGQ